MVLLSRLAAVAVALIVVLVGATPAAAAGSAPTYLRLAHLSPDTPNVDVTLVAVADPARTLTVPGVGYGAVSDYQALPPGDYTVAMRPAGAPATTPPVISTTLTARSGAAYTVAGTGPYAALGLVVLDDELTMPAPGSARLRVVNAAATAPRVDLSVAGGPEIATGVGFAEATGYRTVPVGSWTVDVVAPGGRFAVPVDVTTNATYTVLLLDRPGGVVAELRRDAAGAATVPVGGVDTGLGGMAGPPAVGTGVGVILSILTILIILISIKRMAGRKR